MYKYTVPTNHVAPIFRAFVQGDGIRETGNAEMVKLVGSTACTNGAAIYVAMGK
ncbi:hypothetical protein KZJ38_21445 [Paraburkholderia edwinii]|uniref:Uncharacterized protein n=1 Tax=Paraburkholderia edwinii TaxID=2861782 RepID=A0ABX8UP75_9BURK|nr:hypothetical protein [Paraburkholderia edwinii]QYD68753.1 hypothetical protein KZJ38_21445 [Paraburkholderia edwinii]